MSLGEGASETVSCAQQNSVDNVATKKSKMWLVICEFDAAASPNPDERGPNRASVFLDNLAASVVSFQILLTQFDLISSLTSQCLPKSSRNDGGKIMVTCWTTERGGKLSGCVLHWKWSNRYQGQTTTCIVI